MGIGRRRSIAGSSDEEEEEEEEQEQRVKERPASGRVQDADTATTMNSRAELGTIAGPSIAPPQAARCFPFSWN